MMNRKIEYVVNAPPTTAIPLDDYTNQFPAGYIVEASSAKDAISAIKAYRAGVQWANDLALSDRLNTFSS